VGIYLWARSIAYRFVNKHTALNAKYSDLYLLSHLSRLCCRSACTCRAVHWAQFRQESETFFFTDWSRIHKSKKKKKFGRGFYCTFQNRGALPCKQTSQTCLLLGHFHLKGHLFKMGLTDDPTCERCLKEDESATHILCDCEAIANLRFRHLGQFFM
jgi:hypothetical protein